MAHYDFTNHYYPLPELAPELWLSMADLWIYCVLPPTTSKPHGLLMLVKKEKERKNPHVAQEMSMMSLWPCHPIISSSHCLVVLLSCCPVVPLSCHLIILLSCHLVAPLFCHLVICVSHLAHPTSSCSGWMWCGVVTGGCGGGGAPSLLLLSGVVVSTMTFLPQSAPSLITLSCCTRSWPLIFLCGANNFAYFG